MKTISQQVYPGIYKFQWPYLEIGSHISFTTGETIVNHCSVTIYVDRYLPILDSQPEGSQKLITCIIQYVPSMLSIQQVIDHIATDLKRIFLDKLVDPLRPEDIYWIECPYAPDDNDFHINAVKFSWNSKEKYFYSPVWERLNHDLLKFF